MSLCCTNTNSSAVPSRVFVIQCGPRLDGHRRHGKGTRRQIPFETGSTVLAYLPDHQGRRRHHRCAHSVDLRGQQHPDAAHQPAKYITSCSSSGLPTRTLANHLTSTMQGNSNFTPNSPISISFPSPCYRATVLGSRSSYKEEDDVEVHLLMMDASEGWVSQALVSPVNHYHTRTCSSTVAHGN